MSELMMAADRAIRSIAVAGGGIVALSAAAAFSRALPETRVMLVATQPDPAALADRLPATWPAMARFHAHIGIDERELIRAGIATYHLGTRFEDWSSTGEPWVHAFGNYGRPLGAIAFDQIWWRAHQAGDALAFDRYSVGATLARAGKFVHPASDPNSLGSRYRYALRLDPESYRDFLEQHVARSVTIVRSEIGEVERRDQAVAALALKDGTRVEADLFVDCTGPRGRIISSLDDSLEDWSAWMPFDRMLLESAPPPNVTLTSDLARATDEGWSVEWSLSKRSLRADLRIGGGGIPISRARRLRPWVRNVLALGDAAIALDPLHGMNLDLAQQSILLALELLPTRDFTAIETSEYNRRAQLLTGRVRDFIALHYLRSGRTSGVWAEFARSSPPDSLARTLDQYLFRMRMPFHEEETISRDDWSAALIGLGLVPRNLDPQVAGVPLETIIPAMRQLASEIEESVERVPSYAAYLAGMMR
ncbi:MAG TPA: tryptophan 7-halogenase [Sphingomicrobium sp.]|nr:tryptophan 7-halogenase [Sphingomicrobium sp.]